MISPASPSFQPDSSSQISALAWAGWCVRKLFLLTFFGAICVGGTLVAHRFDHFARRSEFFFVDDVQVSGASSGLEQSVRDLLTDAEANKRANLLLLSLKSAKGSISGLPRVREVSLSKCYPRQLRVEIKEREPIAVVSVGDFYWIDREGVLIDKATPDEFLQARLPVLTGLRGANFSLGKQVEAPHLSEVLDVIRILRKKDPEMLRRFAEMHFTPRNEVVGILEEGVEVRFGDADPLSRIPALASVLREKKDLARCAYLDLRFDSQVVYQ